MYPADLIATIEGEMSDGGFQPLKTVDAVHNYFKNHQGTTLLFINSMCGCAGVGARGAVLQTLATSTHQPDHLVTIFAGVDAEALEAVQDYIKPYPLSSPAIALIKDDSVVHFIERHQLKGIEEAAITTNLQEALQQYCKSTEK